MQGGGVFLRKNDTGIVAAVALQGSLYDYNSTVDSSCTGISNPYDGKVTLYSNNNQTGNNTIQIEGNSGISNLILKGSPGAGFVLGSDLTVNKSLSIESGNLNLNNHKLLIKAH
jgi:hypothetical protein